MRPVCVACGAVGPCRSGADWLPIEAIHLTVTVDSAHKLRRTLSAASPKRAHRHKTDPHRRRPHQRGARGPKVKPQGASDSMIFAIIKSMLEDRNAAKQGKAVPLSEQEDEALMVLYAQGEVRAFEELMRRHERALFNFILRSTKRADVAEELLQEVFLRVIRAAADYEQKAKFTTWVYTIARNLCIDRARKQKRRGELSLDEKMGSDDDSKSFADLLVDEDAQVSHMGHEREVFMERLQRALEQLPEDQREVFLLKEVSGLKFREIADVVGAPVPTVKSRMRYAIQALRGFMADYRDHSFDEEERLEVVRSGE